MTNIDRKANELILQLTRKTIEEEIKWQMINPPENLVIGSDDLYPLYLQTNFKNATIGLFLKKYRYFTDYDKSYWSEIIGLCITDNKIITWEFSQNTPSLVNLFEVARQQASGIDDILNDLLS